MSIIYFVISVVISAQLCAMDNQIPEEPKTANIQGDPNAALKKMYELETEAANLLGDINEYNKIKKRNSQIREHLYEVLVKEVNTLKKKKSELQEPLHQLVKWYESDQASELRKRTDSRDQNGCIAIGLWLTTFGFWHRYILPKNSLSYWKSGALIGFTAFAGLTVAGIIGLVSFNNNTFGKAFGYNFDKPTSESGLFKKTIFNIALAPVTATYYSFHAFNDWYKCNKLSYPSKWTQLQEQILEK